MWSTRWTFVVLGAIYGSWAVRIPDVARGAHVANGQLGGVLLALAAGSLIGMPLASIALRRWSLAQLIRSISTVFAAAAVGLATSPSLVVLLVFALLFGTANGAYGIVINSAATALEARGRRVVSSCHASFSLATLGASLIGGVLVSHVPPWLHLVAVGVVCVLGTSLASSHLPVADRTDATPTRVSLPRQRLVWLASGLAFVALFAEGVVTDWSAFFLQHAVIGHPSAQQTWGYAGFAAAMATGRSAGDKLLERVGERTVLWCSLSTAALGYAVVSVSQEPFLAMAGFTIVGAGLSNLYPAMISLTAARLPGQDRDAAIAAVSGIGYFGFLLGPALLGFATQALGLRPAIATPVVALCWGGVLLTQLLRVRGDDRPDVRKPLIS